MKIATLGGAEMDRRNGETWEWTISVTHHRKCHCTCFASDCCKIQFFAWLGPKLFCSATQSSVCITASCAVLSLFACYLAAPGTTHGFTSISSHGEIPQLLTEQKSAYPEDSVPRSHSWEIAEGPLAPSLDEFKGLSKKNTAHLYTCVLRVKATFPGSLRLKNLIWKIVENYVLELVVNPGTVDLSSLQETLEQNFKYQLWAQSSMRFECYRSKHQASHVRQILNQTASLCFWPARLPQIAERVAFSNKLCSFEFGICSQSGFCEASGIGTLAKFVSKEMLF